MTYITEKMMWLVTDSDFEISNCMKFFSSTHLSSLDFVAHGGGYVSGAAH